MVLNKAAFARALVLASLAATAADQARAAYVLDLTQQGNNVVAAGSGMIDLSGLFFVTTEPGFPEIFPSQPGISIGAGGEIDVYGDATPPPNFGSGGGVAASTGSGNLTIAATPGIGVGFISVPARYVSGSPSQAARSGTVRPSIASALRPAFTNGRGAVA